MLAAADPKKEEKPCRKQGKKLPEIDKSFTFLFLERVVSRENQHQQKYKRDARGKYKRARVTNWHHRPARLYRCVVWISSAFFVRFVAARKKNKGEDRCNREPKKKKKKRYGRRGKVEKEGGRSGNNSSFHGNCLILGQSSPTSGFVPLPSPVSDGS